VEAISADDSHRRYLINEGGRKEKEKGVRERKEKNRRHREVLQGYKVPADSGGLRARLNRINKKRNKGEMRIFLEKEAGKKVGK
jgi:hypothetical protein